MTLIDLHALVQTLKGRGVTLEPKPDGGVRLNAPRPLEPELLEAIRANKAALLEMLSKPRPAQTPTSAPPLEPLPLELRALVRAAGSGTLPKGAVTLETGITYDLERYVLGFTAQYLTGDQSHAILELRACSRAWQGMTRRAVSA